MAKENACAKKSLNDFNWLKKAQTEVLKSFVAFVLESMGHSLVSGDEKVPQMVGMDAQLGKPFQLLFSASVLTNINT